MHRLITHIAVLTIGFLCPAFSALAQTSSHNPLGSQEATFQGLGYLLETPTSESESQAWGVSADGSVVVGFSTSEHDGDFTTEAFRWENGEMEGLGTLEGGPYLSSAAFGVSADGSVVVGRSMSGDSDPFRFGEAFRWTSQEGMEGLGDLIENNFYSEATAVSAAGSVIVGRSLSQFPYEAFRWEDGVMESLAEGILAEAWAISAAGSVIVGTALLGDSQQAFRWTSDDGMIGLGAPPDGQSMGFGVSADGAVVVGFQVRHEPNFETEAFRWTEADGMIGLGTLPGGSFYSEARAVSADGSAVVGTSSGSNGFEVFIWSLEDGMQSLKEILEIDYGLDLDGWVLSDAQGISADGTVIVGTGINPNGNLEAWRVVLPLNVSGEVTPETRATTLTAPRPNPVRGTTTLSLSVDREQSITVEVFDVMGRRVQTLYEGIPATGAETVLRLDASSLSSGMYIIRATGEDFLLTQRVTVIR